MRRSSCVSRAKLRSPEGSGIVTARPWPARTERLATLLDADGLAIVLALADGSYATYAAHNLGEVAWGAAATADLLSRAITQRSTSRTAGVTITLADGRVADTLLLTPVASTERTAAALAIVRVGRPFDDGDVTAATRVAALVALDLRDAHALWSVSHAQRLSRIARASPARSARPSRASAIPTSCSSGSSNASPTSSAPMAFRSCWPTAPGR